MDNDVRKAWRTLVTHGFDGLSSLELIEVFKGSFKKMIDSENFVVNKTFYYGDILETLIYLDKSKTSHADLEVGQKLDGSITIKEFGYNLKGNVLIRVLTDRGNIGFITPERARDLIAYDKKRKMFESMEIIVDG